MSYARRETVTVTTASDGSATAYSDPIDYGVLSAIRYVKTDFANGVDITITSEATGETLWTQADVNASTTVAPRQALHTTAGVAAVYASGGSAVLGPIAIVRDRIKFVIAQGGDTKVGTFHAVLL
jgi:hypothetical protein